MSDLLSLRRSFSLGRSAGKNAVAVVPEERERHGWKGVFFALLVIIFANRVFFLGPWWHRHGVFNVADVANVVIMASTVWFVLFSRQRRILWNGITPLILFHILFVFLQVYLARINYHQQSLVDALAAIRHQFYFLSFFFFLFLLDRPAKIVKLLDSLVVVSLIIVALSLVNYFGPTLFYHQWAEGHGFRGGIVRAFFPGMDLLALASLWVYVKWLYHVQPVTSLCSVLFLIFAHIFRQTRARLMGLLLVMGVLLVWRKKWKHIVLALLGIALITGLLNIVLPKNIVLDQFVVAYENLVEKSGTWHPRFRQIRIDLEEFQRHPWIGSGLSTIRWSGSNWEQIKVQAKKEYFDLGLTTWMKFYGVTGLIWLALFYGTQLRIGLRMMKRPELQMRLLGLFGVSFVGNVLVTFVTLHNLMEPEDIVLVCLVAAILVRASQWSSSGSRPLVADMGR